MKKNKTKAISFSGIATALIVILLFLAGIIDVLDYTASAIAGIIVTFILVEFGTSSAVSVYLSSSVLALLIIPNKVSALLFIAFCGWYSFIKRYIEKLSRPFEIIAKLLIFNGILSIIIIITMFVFMFDGISLITLVVVFVTANVAFVLYDFLLTRLIWLYVNIYRKKFNILKK